MSPEPVGQGHRRHSNQICEVSGVSAGQMSLERSAREINTVLEA